MNKTPIYLCNNTEVKNLYPTVDYSSPSAQFSFDLNKSPLFVKNNKNYINILSVKQMNTLKNVSLLDIFLNKHNIIEPHYHQNSAELIYCITGSVVVSIFNPFTKQLQHYTLTPGKVANVPQGWWHYIVTLVDNTHILAIFDAPTPEVILGSDILKITPSHILAQTYCINENRWNQAIAPVKPATFIESPQDCIQNNRTSPHYSFHPIFQYRQYS